jgi:two-component system CheB/CheR fusion protein
MYFVPEIQGRILTSFHFSLRDAGYLFLGKSEVLLSRSSLFVPVDLRNRIFAKGKSGMTLADRFLPVAEDAHTDGAPIVDSRTRASAFEAVPVAQLVVDTRGALTLANVQARALFGLTQKDMHQPVQDLELSYRPVELRSLIDSARAKRHQVSLRDIEWRSSSGDVRYFDVQVVPLSASDGSPVGTGVTFVDITRYRRLQESLEDSKAKLETAFEELQSTAEELETTNEELQSTNEELETTNEELQSTNEELETMNEELQSTNEELETINDELRERTHDLHQVNAFLESILVSIDAGVAVVDDELRITAWNSHAFDLWGLHSDEVQGQHLANLDLGLPVDELLPTVRSVIGGDGEPEQLVVHARTRRGKEIECRIRCSQLLGPDHAAAGAIILMEQVP